MKRRRRTNYLGTALAATTTAAVGSVAVNRNMDWYQKLDKPNWQPPSVAFGPVWSALYASIAWSGGRALSRTAGSERQSYLTALATNLSLNAGWSWLFFGSRSPVAGLVGIGAMNLSNLALIRRTARIDRSAAAALVPYALWTGFATVLNAEILRRNRDRS